MNSIRILVLPLQKFIWYPINIGVQWISDGHEAELIGRPQCNSSCNSEDEDNNVLHPQSYVIQLNVTGKFGAHNLLQVKQTAEEERCRLSDQTKAICKENISENSRSKNDYKIELLGKHSGNWRSKPWHDQYIKEMESEQDQESTIVTSWRQQRINSCASRTNKYEEFKESAANVDFVKNKKWCMDHISSLCNKIVQVDYEQCHDKIATRSAGIYAKSLISVSPNVV